MLIQTASLAPHYQERRRKQRTRYNLHAIVKLEGGPALPCRVVNASSMGSLIEFEQPTILPRTFKLIVPEIWFEAECEVKHRTRRCFGLQFTSNRREALSRFG